MLAIVEVTCTATGHKANVLSADGTFISSRHYLTTDNAAQAAGKAYAAVSGNGWFIPRLSSQDGDTWTVCIDEREEGFAPAL